MKFLWLESGPQISVTAPALAHLWSLSLLLSKDHCFISFQLIVSLFVLMIQTTSCDITLALLYLLSVPSGLQSPAGPQHPRGQGAGLLWSLLRCGVPLSRARLGPEHLLPGWRGCFWGSGSGRRRSPSQVDSPGDGAPHRAELPGHGVALWQWLQPQATPLWHQTRELCHQEGPHGKSSGVTLNALTLLCPRSDSETTEEGWMALMLAEDIMNVRRMKAEQGAGRKEIKGTCF